MNSRGREKGALLTSDPVGNFPFTTDFDTAVWIQSGQFPGDDLQSLQENTEMGGFFQDHFLSKDEDASTTSDMNDSAYMSQPDTGRRGAAYPESAMQAQTQDLQAHSGLYYPSSLFSPALSSVSSNPFQGSSDMNQLVLPPASDSDSSRAAVGDLPNMMAFNRVPDFNFMANSQGGWPTTDAQTFSGPFAVSPLDASSFMFQNSASMTHNTSPMMYNSDDLVSNELGRRQGFMQRRPHASMNVISNTHTTVEPTRVSTPSSVGTVDRPSRFFATQSQSSQSGNQGQGSSASSAINQEAFTGSNSYFNYQSTDSLSEVQAHIQNESSDKYEEVDDSLDPSGDNSASALEESESTKLARTHPLYQATPQDDDLYHCPNEGEPGCGHKPTKLKCNYDKYVDSHLRPFRCKAPSCSNTPFSSTACLLRHEREAHGMHGHGSKPHLCSFPDCERSIPGNGFPRRYNLFDHMKRVHDYTGATSPLEQEAPGVSLNSSLKRPGSRKRKSSGSHEEVSEKRQKTSKPSAIDLYNAEQRSKQEKEKKLLEQFDKQRAGVLELLNNIQGPFDHAGYEKFMKAADNLKDIIRQSNTQGSS